MNRHKAAFFDEQVDAEWAAADYGPEEMAKVGRLLAESRIGPGMAVIEPGCGTGRLTAILADRVGPQGSVLALDISEKMVRRSRERLAGRENVEVRCASVEEFPFAPGSFDLIICHNVFPHFDDKRTAVEKLVVALKPSGGFVVFHFMNSRQINDLHRKAGTAVEKDLLPSYGEMEQLLTAYGLAIERFADDEQGYLLRASGA